MRPEYTLAETSGFEQREAEQNRIPHTRPYRRADIVAHDNVLNENGVNRHTHDNKKALESKGKQRAEVILSHAAPLAVSHRRHRNGSNRGDEVNLDHSPVGDDENADGERPHRYADNLRLQPQTEQSAVVHLHEPRFKVCKVIYKVYRGVRHDDTRRVPDHVLCNIENPHDYRPCVCHDENCGRRFEYPFEEHPCVNVVHVVFVRDKLYQLQRHYKSEDTARDGEYDVIRERPNHVVDAAVPCLRRGADLYADLRDFGVYVVEHPGKAVHDTINKQFFYPLADGVCNCAQWLTPPFPRPPVTCRRARRVLLLFIRLSGLTEQTGKKRY